MLLQTNVFQDLCGDYTWQLLLWFLGAFLLGLLLGWLLWNKWKGIAAGLETDVASWKAKANGFEADLSTSRYENQKLVDEKASLNSKNGELDLKLKACEESKANMGSNVASAALGFAAGTAGTEKVAAAPTGYAAFLKEDNLQIVEGIGPKIEGLLKAAGISTWAALAASTPEKITEILNEAGSRYRIHNPSTWPEQARLANEGKWKELIKYQRYLGGGKEGQTIVSGQSKMEKLYMKARGLKAFDPNDLKVVEGIGPKIEGLLKDGGINTWAELASTAVERLQEILNNAGDRYRLADPSTWSRQAQLADEGNWDELKEYQDFLQGGKG